LRRKNRASRALKLSVTFWPRLLAATACTSLSLAIAPAAAPAIVGGHAAAPGAYPSVAEVTLGSAFSCTGTLISPSWVLTAGHCGSITTEAVATPIGFPPGMVDVRIGSVKPGQGQHVAVASVAVEPKHFLNEGYDITLLHLAGTSTMAPTRIASADERALWAPGVGETIVGFGTTNEAGDVPDTLQEAVVPVVADGGCGSAYGNFDPVSMLCAGYPQGGVDSCQGDSGGPMFGRTAGGELRLVGATSFGDGCARPGKPGVYARVADGELREWIRSVVPDAIAQPEAAKMDGAAKPVVSPAAAPRHRVTHHKRTPAVRACWQRPSRSHRVGWARSPSDRQRRSSSAGWARVTRRSVRAFWRVCDPVQTRCPGWSRESSQTPPMRSRPRWWGTRFPLPGDGQPLLSRAPRRSPAWC